MFHVREIDNASLIVVESDLDMQTAPALESTILLAATDDVRRIVVSLEACRYCDSSALAVFIRSKKAYGARFMLIVPPQSQTKKIFEITGLVDVLRPCASLDEALGMPRAS